MPHYKHDPAKVEAKAKEMFLAKFGDEGASWELADSQTKVNWRDNARAFFALDEGTRMVRPQINAFG